MKKIAVLGGTPVDTRMGRELLQDLPVELIEVPISLDPQQQTFFQTLPQAEKNTRLRQVLTDLVADEISGVLVYCNSLSGSVDFELLATEFELFILTPFQIYREIAEDYQRLGILSANAQGAAGIEGVLVQQNPHLRVFSVSNLAWVEAVEAKTPSQTIIENFGLLATLDFFQQNQVEAILIGCTHFPYFLADYQVATDLPCIDPAPLLRDKLQAFLTPLD